MQKRLFIAFIALALCSSLFAQQVRGVHPWKEMKDIPAEELSHWSVFVEGGFNVFDGDFSSEMKHPIGYPTVGLGGMYSFTPSWSAMVDYRFAMPRVYGATAKDAEILYKSQMHRVEAAIGLDLVNMFFPYSKKKLVTALIFGGAGMGIYQNMIYFPASTKAEKGNTASKTPQSDNYFKTRSYFLGGLDLSFNVSRSIAVGLRMSYAYFTKDDVDMRGMSDPASKNNDGIADVTATIRYKIDAVKKTHVNNISSDRMLDKMIAAATAVDVTNDHGFYSGQALADAAARSGKKDTVVVYNYTKDTLVINSRNQSTSSTSNSTIINRTGTWQKEEDYYYVYFDPARSNLKEEGLTTIQQIASRMQREPNTCAIIVGFCDNTGSAEYNKRLAQERSQKVTDELIAEYDINTDRLLTISKGILVGKRSTAAYAPNRRVEIQLVSDDAFTKLKQEYREESESQSEYVKQAQQEIHEQKQLPAEIRDRVELPKNGTLSKLARKYYHNTFCWIYIYMANKDVMANPNDLAEGTEINIPELTEEQQKITKEESHRIFKEMQDAAAAEAEAAESNSDK